MIQNYLNIPVGMTVYADTRRSKLKTVRFVIKVWFEMLSKPGIVSTQQHGLCSQTGDASFTCGLQVYRFVMTLLLCN